MSFGCNLNKPEQGKHKDKTKMQCKPKSEIPHGNKKGYPHYLFPVGTFCHRDYQEGLRVKCFMTSFVMSLKGVFSCSILTGQKKGKD